MSDQETRRFLGYSVAAWAVLILLLGVAPSLDFPWNYFTALAQDGRSVLRWGMLIGAAAVAVWHVSRYLPLREESDPDDERPEQPAVVEGPAGEADPE